MSVGQGWQPRWSSDGRQLYYLGIGSNSFPLWAADVTSDGGSGLRIGTPQRLFEFRARVFVPQLNLFAYSLHPDGRILANVRVDPNAPTINLITNWQQAIGAGQAEGR